MSSTFSGFTEDDIKKLNSQNTKEKVKFQVQNLRKEKIFNSNNNKNNQKPLITSKFDMSEDAKLSVNKDIKVILQPEDVDTSSKVEIINSEIKNNENVITTNSIIEKVEKELKSDSQPEIKNKLEEFEAKQKLIKEQNRKRKELLSKALADRTRKTSEEAKKLHEIKEEFKKLDDLLSNDVSMLRHEIEVASYDFMEAQKRYNKIEKEFLEAKLALHQKLERKEMLTEHLCAIIEKNEERKAQKLLELMEKLEMEKYDMRLEVVTENGESEGNE